MLLIKKDDGIDVQARHVLNRTLAGETMSEGTARAVAGAILDGLWSSAETAALLVALQLRGETLDELTGFVRAVRDRSIHVSTRERNVIDTCGTGGSGQNRVNISTAAAIVAAAAGCRVAKHGNRSASGRTGSSDVLEALGVPLAESPAAARECLETRGITFLHAPCFHPGLRHIAGLRAELGVRTIFNLVGPLSNPAGVRRQVVGVNRGSLVCGVVELLKRLGSEHVIAVHGADGADEITLFGETRVCELRDGSISQYQVSPEEFGFDRCDAGAIRGGDAAKNAAEIRRAFQDHATPVRDTILLNAGAAIYVGEVAMSLEEGVSLAREVVRSGLAIKKLNELCTREATAMTVVEVQK